MRTLNTRTATRLCVSLLCLVFGLSSLLFAQTTVSTGSIVGTVFDPQGSVVSGANITITNTNTGQVVQVTTTSAGAYNSGALSPGRYKVQAATKGFSISAVELTVQVSNTATANFKLQVGSETQVIEVQASDVAVNTEQASVQGVLTSTQVDNLPINGRNFLDLAQLEPGVQIQDGQNFDPTKAGYSSISFGGRFGRTARILVDGVDISDETVGTTTQDIPASAISEFQIAQSTLDLSNDLTSSGAVNVTTRSGTNAFHGEAFDYSRSHSFAAKAPGGVDAPFQRHQFGGRFGGPIIKDKLLFFADGERTKQDAAASVITSAPLDALSGTFTQGFRSSSLLGKLDYQMGTKGHLFYRYTYFANALPATFGRGFSVYKSKDYSRNHVIGYDFNTGTFTHSLRFSYLKFQNSIVDATSGSGLPFADLGVQLHVGTFWSGINSLAPQGTPQQNYQLKYDGSKTWGAHVVRYGVSYNHIQGGGFANFQGLAPRITTKTGGANVAFAATHGGVDDPLSYPVEQVRLGNGLGFNTEIPALGFPAGGLGPDNRFAFYIGDNWKVRPNFTLSVGVRYDRDTGRTDSDLPAIPEINAAYPGMGDPVKQANKNFAPQLGIAYDPWKNGKTVFRAGIGIYYENVIYNNVLFDRPLRLRTGAFNQTPFGCNQSTAQAVPTNGGGTLPIPDGVCNLDGNPDHQVAIRDAVGPAIALQQAYQALNPFDPNAPNPNFVGNFIAANASLPVALFAPNYKSPRSVQMNFGVQREIRPGMVLTADYLRNITTKTLLGIDVNRSGDVSLFNKDAALAAISATNSAFECGAGTTSTDIQCAIDAGASMTDYAGNGLTSQFDFGGACPTGPCAFGGINPNVGQGFFLEPIGRAVYNALQMKLSQNVANPMRGVKSLNFQVAYSLSSYKNSGGAAVAGQPADSDQDFVIAAIDNNNPNKFFGHAVLDRTHQLSFGGFADVPFGFRIGITSHFYSPLAGTLTVPNTSSAGEIFRTDFTGDGSVQDPLPGTRQGSFDRGINAKSINTAISHYNTTFGNQATPAGQVLIDQNLFSLAQLQALGGVAPLVSLAPPDQVNFTWLRSMDLKLAWRHTFWERLTVEPSIGFFNIANFSNFNLPPTTLVGLLDGSSGSLNGTNREGNEANRVGNGTGVYSLGSQRQIEGGLKITF